MSICHTCNVVNWPASLCVHWWVWFSTFPVLYTALWCPVNLNCGPHQSWSRISSGVGMRMWIYLSEKRFRVVMIWHRKQWENKWSLTAVHYALQQLALEYYSSQHHASLCDLHFIFSYWWTCSWTQYLSASWQITWYEYLWIYPALWLASHPASLRHCPPCSVLSPSSRSIYHLCLCFQFLCPLV